MVEAVSEFKARVARLRERNPEWRDGQAHFNAMGYPSLGASPKQAKWAWGSGIAASEIDPFTDDTRIPAFLAAAVEAGVLREG